MSASRFIIGIDLGTTNSALAYVDTEASEMSAHALQVPQLTARGEVDARALLPSFLYLAHESEGPQTLPWASDRTFAVGTYARSRGAEAPSRLVSSAKSWLCHPSLDRRAPALPAGSNDVERISPVEASFRYLEHLSEAWDHQVAKGDPSLALSSQDVVLTVPASFDAVARELTAEAAYAAGIEKLTLLEEPQAALYAWLDARGPAWRKELRPGDLLLVVDVGGGTSDFSAIAVVEREGSLDLVRIAVGDHILLGGDNMDLALAYALKDKLEADGKELDDWQVTALVHATRAAKEQLFATDAASASVVIAGRGSKLLGGAIRTELTREELSQSLMEGFFPQVTRDARPIARPRGALTKLGLPYASDPAITRHLAAFLERQATATGDLAGFVTEGGMLRPTAVLFNGGVMRAAPLRERLLDVLQGWLRDAGAPPLRELGGADLDLAVARGAAVFGLSRRGTGMRIRGGTARAYYVGIESAAPAVPGVAPKVSALCVAPFGMEEGTSVDLAEEELGLVVGEPVAFRFFGSSVRRDDVAGSQLKRFSAAELTELPAIEVELPSEGRKIGDVVPVHLRATATDIGTLLLEAIPTSPREPDEKWKIEFSVRGDG